MKKSTKHPMAQQEPLFAEQESEQDGVPVSELDALAEDDLPPGDNSDDEQPAWSPTAPEMAAEPLFSALLRSAVRKQWGDDAVLNDFVDYVAAPLSDYLGHVAAKGGDFAANKRSEAQQKGQSAEDVDHYSADQSLRAHLVNGLFPVLHVAKALKRWGAPQFRYYDDAVRRLFIGGYVLHDWLKLPEIDAELEAAGLRHDSVNAAQHRGLVEAIFLRWGERLGLDAFFAPEGGLQANLHDLIFVASNTQTKWGTLRNLAALPELRLPGPQRGLAEQLCRLADYLAYIGRTPREAATDRSIHRELATLSNQEATLVYQHIAEVRGVLTNLIQNAALEACSSDECVPLLYAPSGVVYLTRRGAFQPPDKAQIGEQVVERVKKLAKQRLSVNFTGFGRDGKGMKHAGYYSLFFTPLEMVNVGLHATLKIIHANKPPSAGKRFDKLEAWLPLDVTRSVMEDVRVDQLAEWCFLTEKTVRGLPGGEDVTELLLKALEIWDLHARFLEVPRDNRAGGVGYHWYFAAGHYLQRNPGLDPQSWAELMRDLATQLVKHLHSQQEEAGLPTIGQTTDGFADLREYVQQVLSFGPMPADGKQEQLAPFDVEFHRYSAAKKRGKESMCSLCSSSYTVGKQQESAILFAPQVYSNKLTLHGANALRDICSICGLEIMLRQLLMNDSDAVGGNFEGRRLRYLFFYPMYFFTPETLDLFRDLQGSLRAVSIAELRKQIQEKGAGPAKLVLTPARWQRLQDLLLTPPGEAAGGKDRFLRLHFPEKEPITFFFMGVPPPGRESKDAEAWVLPALLALLLPLCVDIKVVASETSLPFVNEGSEFDETVFFDSAHAAIGYLLGDEHINLDHILPLLNRLAVTYMIHLDSNAKMSMGKFDYRWQDLPPLARRLSESSLYAFHYLKKWQRSNRFDAIPSDKAQLYLQYQAILAATAPIQEGNDNMSHARTLTELYRRFYRAKPRASSNSILRPVSVAAHTVLSADRRIYVDADGLSEIVRGELRGFVDRVASRRADGYVPRIEVDGKKLVDEDAIRQFADYFVKVLFFDALRADVSALRGRQLNLLKNACEVIYRDLDAQYWAERNAHGEPDEVNADLNPGEGAESLTLFDE